MLVYADVSTAATPSDLATDWQTLATAIDGASGAQITKGRVTLLEAMSGGKSSPAADSRIEQSAILNFSNGDTTRRQGIVLPAVSTSEIVGGKLNIATGALSTLVALLSSGTSLANSAPTNAAFQALTTLYDAFVSFRKHRKQLQRSSIEA